MPKQVQALTPSEFEQYMATLVRALDFAKTGHVYTNKLYKGIRQPGDYEIDVALEVQLAPSIKFTLIVECKNWTRPVDRPVVQKLAQTRDAISADKAAIASPVGFTKEAKEVARTLEIALWVVTVQEWIIEYDNGATELSLDALKEDSSRDWSLDPARIGLLSWESYYLRMFPPKANLPSHLKWARFVHLNRSHEDGRRKITQLIMQKLIGVSEYEWCFDTPRVRGIGLGHGDGLRIKD
jgi:hypothetical protein